MQHIAFLTRRLFNSRNTPFIITRLGYLNIILGEKRFQIRAGDG